MFSSERRRRLALLLLVAAFAVTAPACGGADSSAPASAPGGRPATTDVCALLTAEDVAQALGEPAGAPEPGMSMPGSGAAASMTACAFHAAGSPRTIGVTLWRSTDSRYTSAGLDGARATLRDVTGSAPEEISGLGQVAFWGGFQLHVVKDANTYVIVAPSGISDEVAARAAALGAARAILSR
jgi:hypothetical protein